MTQETAPVLQRSLGLRGAVFLGLGSIFGSGVFVAIGVALGITGPSVIAAIIVAASLATCNALSSAQLAAAYPVSGGTYEYGYRLLNPIIGFSAGWLFLLAKSASAATAALGTVAYVTYLLGAENYLPVLASGLVLLMTGLVCLGLQRSNAINTAIVSVTLLCLFIFFYVVAANFETKQLDNLAPFFKETDHTFAAFLYACALMFVAFTGYGRIATMGEEVKNPRHIIPRAIIITLIISAIIYMGVAIAVVLTVGVETALAPNGSATIIETAAQTLEVSTLPEIVVIGAVTAMLGVLLNLIMGLSRVVLAMARRNDMPPIFSKIAKQGSPTLAVIAVGLFVAGLAAIGNIKLIWSFSAFTVLIYYAITNLAALKLSKSQRIYPRAISMIGLSGCLALAFFVPIEVWALGIALIIIGLIAREAIRRLS